MAVAPVVASVPGPVIDALFSGGAGQRERLGGGDGHQAAIQGGRAADHAGADVAECPTGQGERAAGDRAGQLDGAGTRSSRPACRPASAYRSARAPRCPSGRTSGCRPGSSQPPRWSRCRRRRGDRRVCVCGVRWPGGCPAGRGCPIAVDGVFPGEAGGRCRRQLGDGHAADGLGQHEIGGGVVARDGALDGARGERAERGNRSPSACRRSARAGVQHAGAVGLGDGVQRGQLPTDDAVADSELLITPANAPGEVLLTPSSFRTSAWLSKSTSIAAPTVPPTSRVPLAARSITPPSMNVPAKPPRRTPAAPARWCRRSVLNVAFDVERAAVGCPASAAPRAYRTTARGC